MEVAPVCWGQWRGAMTSRDWFNGHDVTPVPLFLLPHDAFNFDAINLYINHIRIVPAFNRSNCMRHCQWQLNGGYEFNSMLSWLTLIQLVVILSFLNFRWRGREEEERGKQEVTFQSIRRNFWRDFDLMLVLLLVLAAAAAPPPPPPLTEKKGTKIGKSSWFHLRGKTLRNVPFPPSLPPLGPASSSSFSSSCSSPPAEINSHRFIDFKCNPAGLIGQKWMATDRTLSDGAGDNGGRHCHAHRPRCVGKRHLSVEWQEAE